MLRPSPHAAVIYPPTTLLLFGGETTCPSERLGADAYLDQVDAEDGDGQRHKRQKGWEFDREEPSTVHVVRTWVQPNPEVRAVQGVKEVHVWGTS